jgi:hypothetical protein
MNFTETYRQRLWQLGNEWNQAPLPCQPDLDTLLELVLADQRQPEVNRRGLVSTYKRQLALGRANVGLYELLGRIYEPAFGSDIEVSGGSLRLARSDRFAACHVELPAGMKFVLSGVLGAPGPRSPVEAVNLIEHRRVYDIQGPFVPKKVTEFYGSIRGGEVFAMKSVGLVDGHLELDLATANYGQVVDTCDCLTTEAYILASLMSEEELRNCEVAEALDCLPWRRDLHEREGGLANALLRPRSRAAGLGMACLTVFDVQESPPQVRAIWVKRGSNVAVLTDIYHVVPAGMVACLEPGHLDADDLLMIVHKEYLEELFNDQEAEEQRTRAAIKHHVEAGIAKKLYIADEGRKQVTIAQTGLAIDLTNLRPEICVINEVRNPLVTDELRARMEANWENLMIEHGDERPDTSFDAAASEGQLIRRSFEPKDWVQTGAVAWLRGMEWLQRMHFDQEQL